MNNIIRELKKYSNSNDILKDIYGIDSQEKFDLCIIAPSWRIEKIVQDKVKFELIYQDQFSVSNRMYINDKKILYVNLQIGSSNIIDFCLCCNSLNCENFIFIGSAGALKQNYQLGDIVIPEYSISGDGASLYLHQTLNPLNLFKKAFPDEELSHKLYNVCEQFKLSGLPPQPFLFYGFLNSKKGLREKELKNLQNYPYTMIFYEAPHRIEEMLQSLLEIFGNRRISISREISKIYEEIYQGTIEEVQEEVKEGIKGEIVVVVEGNQKMVDFSTLTIEEHVNLYMEDGLSSKEAIKKVAIERNIPKSIVYNEYHKIRK